VVKNINLVKSLNVPIIGIIENMSGFICPQCKNEIFIFGKDGGAKVAKEMHIPFLGKLPLDVETSSSSDIGNPIIFKEPESEISKKIFDIVNKIEDRVLKKEGSV
jgi:ATP-binding protein involved in chromosome partitioning